jgi:predicted ATPase with chaperone activity
MQLPEFTVPRPNSIEETGLSINFLCELTLRVMFTYGTSTAGEIIKVVRLPFYGVLEEVLKFLSAEELCFIRRGQNMSPLTYEYQLTEKGQARALALLERSQYVGPAPVPFSAYVESVHAQSVRGLQVTEEELRQAFSHLVINPQILDILGPAINSGRSLFLFGAPGNGKTAIAQALTGLIGGTCYVPYAVEADGQIIEIYDMGMHGPEPEGLDPTQVDARWVPARRPVVSVGGELTMAALDLTWDPVAKCYQAPFQVKANGGVFFIDDFGRQMVSPQELLNRWIVPLESGVDFLTLHTGQKLEVPFDLIIMFSTNLDPKDLVDDAFLRRIRYKIRVDNPTPAQFREIFRRASARYGVPYDAEMVDYLQDKIGAAGLELRSCQPRDILEQVLDIARYRNAPAVLTPELLDLVCHNYLVSVEQG